MISQTSSCLSFLVSATHTHIYQCGTAIYCRVLEFLYMGPVYFVKSNINIICILHFFLFLLCRYLHSPCLGGIDVAFLVCLVHLRVMHILISKLQLWRKPFCILLRPCLGITHISSLRL